MKRILRTDGGRLSTSFALSKGRTESAAREGEPLQPSRVARGTVRFLRSSEA